MQARHLQSPGELGSRLFDSGRARSSTGVLAAVAVVAALLSGCAADTAAQPAGPASASRIEVIAGGEGAAAYAFELPERVPPGPTRISLTNNGDEPHHAQLFRLHQDATVDQLAAALATGDPAAPLEHGSLEGGTALVGPGQTSRADAIVELTEGRYVVICVVDGPDGVPHVAHGMLRQFQVSGGAAAPAGPAAPEVEVQLLDYGFRLPDTISAGALLEVTNVAAMEPHEMIVARLHDGAKAKEVGDAIAAGTRPPATFVGGVQAILPRASQRLQLDLEPGAYAVLCGIPSPDRTPHFAKGMIQEVTIT
jgi:hypothetical protein